MWISCELLLLYMNKYGHILPLFVIHFLVISWRGREPDILYVHSDHSLAAASHSSQSTRHHPALEQNKIQLVVFKLYVITTLGLKSDARYMCAPPALEISR
jgi:hypothetical protein